MPEPNMLGYPGTPGMLAPEEEENLPGMLGPNLADRAYQTYPKLRDLGIRFIDSSQAGAQDFRKIETYPADERDNPYPGQPTIEQFDPDLTPEIFAAETLHILKDSDPIVKGLRSEFVASMTPEQNQQLRRQYEHYQQTAGESRPFEQWAEVSGIDQWFGGRIGGVWPDDMYTENQLGLFKRLEGHLRGSPDEAMRQKMKRTMEKRDMAHFSWRDVLGMQPPPDPMGPEPPAWWPPAPAVDPYTGEVSESDVQQIMPAAIEAMVPVGLGAMALGAMKGNRGLPPTSGILGGPAFHGSPHRFDKFDIEKIGTGEGAQAYGHGLYFAESPGVAKTYQAQGARGTFKKLDGTVFDPYAPDGLKNINVRATLGKTGGDIDATIARAEGLQQSIPGTGGANLAAADLPLLRKLKAEGGLTQDIGTLYEVDIPDEQIAKMLDWDKPLSEQPEMVGKLRALADEHPIIADSLQDFELKNSTGASIYSSLQDDMRRSAPLQNLDSAWTWAAKDFIANDMDPIEGLMSAYQGITPNQAQAAVITARGGYAAEASRQLREAGIPGIRYLDQDSRGVRILSPKDSIHRKWTVGLPDRGVDKLFDTEKEAIEAAGKMGTRNLVLFSDENIKILKRSD